MGYIVRHISVRCACRHTLWMVVHCWFQTFHEKECFHNARDSKHVPELSTCQKFRIALACKIIYRMSWILTFCWSYFAFSSCILFMKMRTMPVGKCLIIQAQPWGMHFRSNHAESDSFFKKFVISLVIYKILLFLKFSNSTECRAGQLWKMNAVSSYLIHESSLCQNSVFSWSYQECSSNPTPSSTPPPPGSFSFSVFRCLVTSLKNNLVSRQGAWQVQPLKVL